jgi:hypothetical protein
MTITLPKPIRQLLAVALLVGTVLAVLGLGVMPVATHVGDLQTQIEQERLVLAHLLAAERNGPDIREAAKLAQTASAARLTVDGESDAIRAANLQSLVGGIAAKSGLQMRSLRNLPARDRNELRMLGVQVQFLATVEQLRRALVEIEAQQPYLFVDTLQITPLPGAIAAGGDNGGTLDVRIDVLGAVARPKG